MNVFDQMRARAKQPNQRRATGPAPFVRGFLEPQYADREARTKRLQGQYDAALADPTAAATRFSDFFKTAADTYGAQANRDFSNTLARTQANTAARFGGNASSEEQRNVYNTSDLFARNLTEALAGYAPQAAQMGLNYTGQLGQAAGNAEGSLDDLSRLILSGIGMYPKKEKGGSVLGALVGGGLGFLKGGPAGAAAGAYQGYQR